MNENIETYNNMTETQKMRCSISQEVLNQIMAHLGNQPYIVAAPLIDKIREDIVPIAEDKPDTQDASDSELPLSAALSKPED